MQRNKKQKIGKAVFAFFMSGMLFVSFARTAYAVQESAIGSEESGSLIDEALTKEQADEIFHFIVQKIAECGLDSEEAVRNAITEGEEEFQVFLSEEEKKKIVQMVDQVNTWGLDAQGLAKKAEELYDEYGMELLEHPEKAAAEVVKSSISSSLKGIGDFFAGIGRGIKGFLQDSIKSFFDIF
ncbi:MAG: DUF1002 domain-containing protein [Lachnospiraceae bacterium]|nr:DUF1002 domain-containing protein [Lachnospiraceae bacterium]